LNYRVLVFAPAQSLGYLGGRNRRNPSCKNRTNPVFMKRRVRKIANFFAFNLLFFALYLNFIHKDKVVFATEEQSTAPAASNAAFSGTVLVKNPEKYLEHKQATETETVAQSTAQ
jgi:hypothetical protein